MKVKFLNVCTAILLVGGAFLSIDASAQTEEVSPNELQDPNHLEYSLTEDKPALSEHDSKSKVLTRDSISSHSRSVSTLSASTKKSPDPGKSINGKEDDDDTLSFNFLYYIIQKFKISDLIDE